MSNPSEGTPSKKPALSAFRQQQLKAWQPILTPIPVIIAFAIVGVIFLILGIVLLTASNEVVEVSKRYDNCALYSTTNTTCSIEIEVTKKMSSPVYMYYRLENYYQNHRRYVKSRNDDQLRGEKVSSYSALEDCDPRKSKDGSKDKENFWLPCGLIAWSLFNDTFLIYENTSTTPITLKKSGIAWSSDVDSKFNNPPADAPGIRIIDDFEDEDFIVWMRTAGLPNFKKLYRIIDTDLEKGTYRIEIENNYPVDDFDGKKYVVLSTTSWIGGKNSFLGWAYIVVAIICIVQAVAFAIKHKVSPRKLGDTKYLDWNK